MKNIFWKSINTHTHLSRLNFTPKHEIANEVKLNSLIVELNPYIHIYTTRTHNRRMFFFNHTIYELYFFNKEILIIKFEWLQFVVFSTKYQRSYFFTFTKETDPKSSATGELC